MDAQGPVETPLAQIKCKLGMGSANPSWTMTRLARTLRCERFPVTPWRGGHRGTKEPRPKIPMMNLVETFGSVCADVGSEKLKLIEQTVAAGELNT